ncbi:FecR family protein [Sunxiuqinia sp. sy24]|uniref:FecR family protein n=1 Tax=Sunxiuqinia sp. sy24 TaxID=3461495 RepID=UPI0040454463
MKHAEINTYESLIADTQFVRWAKGKQVDDSQKWEEWKANHPDKAREFDEACQAVRMFSFATPAINDLEVDYLKQKAFDRSKKQRNTSRTFVMLQRLTRVAAVLFIPLLLFTTWTLLDKKQLENTYVSLVENKLDEEISVVAPIGTRTIVDLPDGSKVWLNAGSQLTYPPIFANSGRTVRLEGEAFFEISKDETPFKVENFGPTIKVYGTEFNVNAYSEEEVVTVALVEGRVSLAKRGGEMFIQPGEVSFFDKSSQSIRVERRSLERFLCWREGKYIFRGNSLNSILRVLQRQYNVEFVLANPGLGNAKYNFTFQNESLEQILELLELSAPIQFDYTKGYLSKEGDYVKGKVKIREI